MPNTPQNHLPIAVDVMGGDHGPGVVIEGAVAAWMNLGISVALVGHESEITSHLRSINARISTDGESGVSVIHAPEVITMEDSPSRAIRTKPRSSVRVAFELVRDGKASAVVSPGNTGAMMAAGLFVVGTLPGIARPAIASLIPRVGGKPPVVFLDSGANIDCHASQLVQFALMGNFYAVSALGIRTPRVALLSNGTESTKGTDIIRSTAMYLSELDEIDFVGYVEGRDIAKDVADVVVCDGFTGNIVLKTMEGSVELVIDSIKEYVERSARGKLGMWLAKPVFKSLFGEKLDPSAYGGAPLLGLAENGIVCHGASKQRAITNAIRVAQRLVSERLVNRLEEALSALDPKLPDGQDEDIWNRMEQRFSKRKPKRSAVSSVAGTSATVDGAGPVNEQGGAGVQVRDQQRGE